MTDTDSLTHTGTISTTEQNVQEEVDVSNSDLLKEDSDDEFGDFEEVDQADEDIPRPPPTPLPELKQGKVIVPYNGDFNGNASNISCLVDKIFQGIPNEEKTTDPKNVIITEHFEFDDREGKIFDQLITDDLPSTHIIWKKSMIFKQCMLNLDIPLDHINKITGVVTQPKGSNSNTTTEFSDLYKIDKSMMENPELDILLKQVPNFKSLNIIKNSEELTTMLTNTTAVITTAHQQLKEEAYDETAYLMELTKTKKTLLDLLSIWNEKIEDTKADNELFSSYVENLIGNTQKFRRVNKAHK